MGRKGVSTSSKKESWTVWKTFQGKKKKQDASSDNDTCERGIVHAIGIAAIVSARIWVSVVISDDDDDALPSLGGTPSPKVRF